MTVEQVRVKLRKHAVRAAIREVFPGGKPPAHLSDAEKSVLAMGVALEIMAEFAEATQRLACLRRLQLLRAAGITPYGRPDDEAMSDAHADVAACYRRLKLPYADI